MVLKGKNPDVIYVKFLSGEDILAGPIFEKQQELRYGENPHQQAASYKQQDSEGPSILNAKQEHGKGLSFNNLVDANSALESVLELTGPGVSVIKHTNPCGYATGNTLAEAFEAAWFGDPVSAFGSVDAFNREVDLETAKKIVETNKKQKAFVEVVIAPSYSEKAVTALKEWRDDLRILSVGDLSRKSNITQEIKYVKGGLLVQAIDDKLYLGTIDDLFRDAYKTRDGKTVGVVTKEKPDKTLSGLYDHAWKAAKHTKSNAIVIAREYKPGCYQVLGMGAGQPNRAVSVRIAAEKSTDNLTRGFDEKTGHRLQPPEDYHYEQRKHSYIGEQMDGCVLASDAMFPFKDGIDDAAKTGVKYIIQPGGSKKDDEVIKAADEHGIAMIFTGIRHFKH